LIKSTPQFIELYIKPARQIYLNRGSVDQFQNFLIKQYEITPVNAVAIELLESYLSSDKHEELLAFLRRAIELSASLEVYGFAFRYLKSRPQKLDEVWRDLSSQFQRLKNSRIAFVCNVCGYESQAMHWNCPSCKTWSSFKPV